MKTFLPEVIEAKRQEFLKGEHREEDTIIDDHVYPFFVLPSKQFDSPVSYDILSMIPSQVRVPLISLDNREELMLFGISDALDSAYRPFALAFEIYRHVHMMCVTGSAEAAAKYECQMLDDSSLADLDKLEYAHLRRRYFGFQLALLEYEPDETWERDELEQAWQVFEDYVTQFSPAYSV